MLFEIILPLGLVLPGLGMLKLARIRVDDKIELLSYSYTLSLAIMFVLLYLGGMVGAFGLASLAFLVIMILSSAFVCVHYVKSLLDSKQRLGASLGLRDSEELLIAAIATIGLLVVYAVFLSTRAILDADVTQLYLPLAREIVARNMFTYGTGYDYLVFLKPIGASVIYAWTYVVSGSAFAEEFRLMPLVPILVLIALTYQISAKATKSRNIGIISTAVFLILPFQDRFILCNALYPDVFYYPLVFLALYLLIKVVQTGQEKSLPWMGLSLGVASLLKAQAIYFVLTALIVLVVYEIRHRKVSLIICCMTPFYVLIPAILTQPSYLQGTALFSSILSPTYLILFIFLAFLPSVCYLLLPDKTQVSIGSDRSAMRSLIKTTVMMVVPLVALSSLWYMSNFLRFGSFIYTSPIGLKDYDWALQVLDPIGRVGQQAQLSEYLMYFMFVFVNPAAMGYVMLLPLLIGLLVAFKTKLESLKLLLFIEIVFLSLVLSNVVLSLSSSSPGYNPRDIIPLTPLLATLSAIGIDRAASVFKGNSARVLFTSFLLVAYFGFVNYLQSILVWFTARYYATSIGSLMSALGGIAGMDLFQASLQMSYGNIIVFVGQNALKMLLISLLAGVPILVILVFHRYRIRTRLGTVFGRVAQKTHSDHPSERKHGMLERDGFLIFLILLVIIAPRAEIYAVQGGPQQIEENQLKASYEGLYGLLQGHFEGGILTFEVLDGLPYYLPSIRIIDLSFSENLAALKDCFQSVPPSECAARMRNYGIHYLLLAFSYYPTQQLDASLNSTFSKIVQDTSVATLIGAFGGWELYELGT